ncbi:hypothetical protein HY635_00370, partial [Candidatus Uhrbacteria bacterium]|nr:hypothetical protein [Candidatus Uhrbacteria bacterium]
ERDQSVNREALDRVVAEFGMYTWHYRRAWEEVYERNAKADEERRFLEVLPTALREQVLRDSGSVRGKTPDVEEERSDGSTSGVGVRTRRPQDIVRLPAFEHYTPEDRLIIEEALLRARREAGDQLGAQLLAGELPDYEEVALRWKQERLRIEEQLLKLRKIARAKPPLAREIQNVIADYELGFSGWTGREPTLTELKGVVADYANRS